MLAKIPLVDLRGYTPLDLLVLFRQQARLVTQGAADFLGVGRYMIRAADSASRRWLEKSRNPYLPEIAMLAEALRMPGSYFLNTFMEWGCTSGAWASAKGPLLRRVVDWPLPRLGEFPVVAQFSGKLGSYFNVTWPGYSGMLQGMAPNRFAACANLGPIRKSGAGAFGDWLAGRFKVHANMALPPTHLLRRVFDEARDYGAARTMLATTPIAVPALFVLTGTKSGEGCVIERTETNYAVREMGAARACATNQFGTHLNDTIEGWRPRGIDSAGRYAKAVTLKADEADFSWFSAPIANAHSRLVMSANAATGLLRVMGSDGGTPVTQIFDLTA